MWEKVKTHLVDDWRRVLHFWSVQWALLGSVVLPIMAMAPQILPPEILALFPPAVRGTVTGVWCILFIVFRAWQQKHPNAVA